MAKVHPKFEKLLIVNVSSRGTTDHRKKQDERVNKYFSFIVVTEA